MNKILAILGPTATGKTDLAFELASKFDGVIINFDSVQVYKKLDIISGKDIPDGAKFLNLKKEDIIPNKYNFGYYLIGKQKLFLLDLVEPTYNFSVSEFVKICIPVIKYIQKQDLLPILVGGTAFYIKALIEGVETLNIPPNINLREKLEKKSVEDLIGGLKKLDCKKFEKMNYSDIRNKRRLIRAIEIADYKLNKKDTKLSTNKLNNCDILKIGLFCNREILKQRIKDRVENRIKRGALSEARSLFDGYNALSPQVRSADGYHSIFDYLLNKTNLATAVDRWNKEDYHHAKKQMTFFKRDKKINWFNISDQNLKEGIKNCVRIWLEN